VIELLVAMIGALGSAFRPRATLVAENLALATARRPSSEDEAAAARSDRSRVLDCALAYLVAMGGHADGREARV
jgi:hypothetical protein